MGEAERLPSTSERDTEIPEVERSARELDGKARRRPETPEAGRRRRRPLPETVEVSRRLPSPIQSVVFSSRPRLQSRTPRPTGHPRLGHAQWAARRMGVACCSWRGALRGRTIDRLHSPLNLCGSVDARWVKQRVKHESLGLTLRSICSVEFIYHCRSTYRSSKGNRKIWRDCHASKV